MNITAKNRTELKAYYKTNDIPTEQHYGYLINAGLNQKEDGVAKISGQPLSIQAEGDVAGIQPLLAFYKSFSDANPTWSVNQNPRTNANDPNTKKPGLNIADSSGTSRLFIKQDNGNVGIGTIEPSHPVHIKSGNNVGLFESTGNQAYLRLHHNEGIDKRIELASRAGGRAAIWVSTSGDVLNVLPSGRVGIGNADPQETLHVNGSVRGNRNGALRISSGTGYVDVGSKNADWSHFATDRDKFYFNKAIHVNTGNISSYDENLKLQTVGTTRLTILNSNGNVGIGNTNPSAKLVVQDSSTDSVALLLRSKDTPSSGSTYDAIQLKAGWHDTSSSSWGENRLSIQGKSGGSSWTEIMTLKANGKVGIGNTNPDQLLTVQGHVNIGGTGDGTLHTRHVHGKSHTSASLDHLYLQYNTGKNVYVGKSNNSSNLTVYGSATVTGLRFDTQVSSHMNYDGALYRYSGQAYLTMDDNLYIRDHARSVNRAHFHTGGLRVDGNLEFNSLHAIGGVTSGLRIIAGRVNSNGGKQWGHGFSSTRNDTGRFTITFDAAYSSIPAVVATVHGNDKEDNFINIYNRQKGSFVVQIVDDNKSNNTNWENDDFCFIAIGI